MKKFIVITVIYTALVVAFDMVSSYVFANAELTRPYEMPCVLFMWIFSCWIAALLIIKIIDRFIKCDDLKYKKAIENIIFYLQARAAFFIIIICGSWSLQHLSTPYAPPGEDYFYVIQEQIGVIRFVHNYIYLSYIPIVGIVVWIIYLNARKKSNNS